MTGTGDLGAKILANVPEAFRSFVEPFIPNIVTAVHQAFAIAIASTFWVSIVAALLAAVFVLFLREAPMRETFEMAEEGSAPSGVEPGAA